MFTQEQIQELKKTQSERLARLAQVVMLGDDRSLETHIVALLHASGGGLNLYRQVFRSEDDWKAIALAILGEVSSIKDEVAKPAGGAGGVIEIFSDGSSIGNLKKGQTISATDKAGWGFVLAQGGKEIARDNGQMIGGTIDMAELTAIKEALLRVKIEGLSAPRVLIYIDRQNLVGSWNGAYVKGNKWVAVKTPKFARIDGQVVRQGELANQDIWDQVAAAANGLEMDVVFVWAPNAHDRGTAKGKAKKLPVNNPVEPVYFERYNDIADKLADQAKNM
jgi:ribonuclease HI